MTTEPDPSPIDIGPVDEDDEGLDEQVTEVGEKADEIFDEIGKRIVGQKKLIEDLLIAVCSRGHSLLVGVPGLAKTKLVRTLSDVLGLDFSRIQFTPDLMPADITGTDILREGEDGGRRELEFMRGPVFTNLLLADEINRTPPKTQAALLQAMQEYEVSAGRDTYPLDRPFLVFATQNPIEQEGTYPLPEAQLDRFMFQLDVGYPDSDEEVEIVQRTTVDSEPDIETVISRKEILDIQKLVRRVPISDGVAQKAVDLVRMTRGEDADAPDFVEEYIDWGGGPRASQYLVLGAKARALLHGRFAVRVDDIKELFPMVIRHRIVPSFKAEAEGLSTSDLVSKLLESYEE